MRVMNDKCLVQNRIEFIKGSDTAAVYFTKKKYMDNIRDLAIRFPEKVDIVMDSEDKLIAIIPVKSIRLDIKDRNRDPVDEKEREEKIIRAYLEWMAEPKRREA